MFLFFQTTTADKLTYFPITISILIVCFLVQSSVGMYQDCHVIYHHKICLFLHYIIWPFYCNSKNKSFEKHQFKFLANVIILEHNTLLYLALLFLFKRIYKVQKILKYCSEIYFPSKTIDRWSLSVNERVGKFKLNSKFMKEILDQHNLLVTPQLGGLSNL